MGTRESSRDEMNCSTKREKGTARDTAVCTPTCAHINARNA